MSRTFSWREYVLVHRPCVRTVVSRTFSWREYVLVHMCIWSRGRGEVVACFVVCRLSYAVAFFKFCICCTLFLPIFGDPADAEGGVEAAPRAYRGGEAAPGRGAKKMARSPPHQTCRAAPFRRDRPAVSYGAKKRARLGARPAPSSRRTVGDSPQAPRGALPVYRGMDAYADWRDAFSAALFLS